MPEWLTYELINDFQTAIVGIIGFGGVVLTLRANANLHTKRLNAEAKTMALGFRTVFEVIEGSLSENAKVPNPEPGGTWLAPKLNYNLYAQAMPELGKLHPEISSSILNSCLLVDQLNGQIHLLSKKEHDRYFEIPAERTDTVRKLFVSIAGKLRATIKLIDSVHR